MGRHKTRPEGKLHSFVIADPVTGRAASILFFPDFEDDALRVRWFDSEASARAHAEASMFELARNIGGTLSRVGAARP